MTIGSELDAALASVQGVPGPKGDPGEVGPPGVPGTSPTVDLSGLQADIKVLYSSVLDLQTRMTTAETALASGPQITPQDLLSMMGQMAADMNGLNPADLATISQEVQAIQKALQPPVVAPPVTVNLPPVWQTVPTLIFVQGFASSISIAGFVTDSDPLTITKNAVPLPAGVTYDPAAKRFIYDGAGPVGIATGNILTADDGRTP